MPNKSLYQYEYPRPAVTVDCVVFGLEDKQLHILLIERLNEPFAKHWALPGGFVDLHEDLDLAAYRELKEETHLDNIQLHQIGGFGTPHRDPRGHTITVAYYTLVNKADFHPKAGDDASKAQWFPTNQMPPIAFDHQDIFNKALHLLHQQARTKRNKRHKQKFRHAPYFINQ